LKISRPVSFLSGRLSLFHFISFVEGELLKFSFAISSYANCIKQVSAYYTSKPSCLRRKINGSQLFVAMKLHENKLAARSCILWRLLS